jgi:antitoxin component of MazEF toxin-antitoxin module
MPSRPFVTRVCRNGNSLTLVIPHAVRLAKNIQRGDHFGITVVDNSIVYTKLSDDKNVEVAGAAAADAAQRLKFDDDQKAIA